ncbi:HWE histidine kinase domain-containing protein [Hyphomonas sp.]|uniref:HWE histidine kinase domain-containing protein n=1 Tax=Hyphomonas sp. TaxID=87 RepID=UPI00391B63DC
MRSFLQRLPSFISIEGSLPAPLMVATYIASLALFIVAVILRMWLEPFLPPGFPFLTFFPAVLISGFVFGVRQGILVAVLSGIASWYLFILPAGFDFSGSTLVALGLYAFVVSTELALIWLMMRAYRSEAAAVSEARRLAEQQETMAQELDHRMKNIFATMNAIISLSLKGASTADELAARLRERVSALGRSNLLLRGLRDGEEAALHRVIEHALEPFSIVGTPRLTHIGPRIPIGGQTMVVMSLIFHELGTNAVKYGALSVPAGKVSVNWHLSDADAENDAALHLEWREALGPPPDPAARPDGGFGSTLMNRLISTIGGSTSTELCPHGAIVRISMPAIMLNPAIPQD